jgi:hypothetical protein
MQFFLLGILALLLALWGLHRFAVANPAQLARHMRITGGLAALTAGGVLALRGLMGYAIWLVGAGVWMLLGNVRPAWLGQRTGAPQTSRVTTDHLIAELDHATGALHAEIRTGPHAGRRLDELRPAEVAGLWQEWQFTDPPSAQILETWLDRAHPTWRDDLARRGGSGGGSSAGGVTSGTGMTREAALEILGLGPDASEDDIRRAHRELMLKVHPDRGGSHALAAQINSAKATLLGGK